MFVLPLHQKMAALIITLTKDDNDDGNNKALNPKTVLFLFTVCV